MTDVDRIVKQIGEGAFDGRLDDITLAIVDRVRSGAVAVNWKLTLEGDEWTQESVTLGEMRFAEQHCYVTDDRGRRRNAIYIELDPRTSAEHALALIVAHLHKAQGQPLDAALKRAEAITASELAGIVGEYEVQRPGKDGSSLSTS